MKLSQKQIKKLTTLIYEKISREGLITVKVPEKKILDKIESILFQDARTQEVIETEAKEMMKKFKDKVQSGEIDYQKMYGMILKQLMKDKKFIL
ncbi:MAG: DUF507 family protein [Deltaproteobacteria bacterium]|nr:DUF507 family protein [Deltaproteobacteria bacterium]